MSDEVENDLWNYFVDEADQSNEWRTFLSGYEYSKKEIDSLKKQLDEAVKVIEFYADKDNWKDMDLLGYEPCIKEDSETGGYGSTMPEETDHLTVGGKKAREFLKSMKVKNEA